MDRVNSTSLRRKFPARSGGGVVELSSVCPLDVMARLWRRAVDRDVAWHTRRQLTEDDVINARRRIDAYENRHPERREITYMTRAEQEEHRVLSRHVERMLNLEDEARREGAIELFRQTFTAAQQDTSREESTRRGSSFKLP